MAEICGKASRDETQTGSLGEVGSLALLVDIFPCLSLDLVKNCMAVEC